MRAFQFEVEFEVVRSNGNCGGWREAGFESISRRYKTFFERNLDFPPKLKQQEWAILEKQLTVLENSFA